MNFDVYSNFTENLTENYTQLDKKNLNLAQKAHNLKQKVCDAAKIYQAY